MDLTHRGLLALSFLFLASVANAQQPLEPETGFRAIVASVRAQEKLLPTAVHYQHSEKSPDGATLRREAFALEDGTLLKSVVERTSPKGEDLTEYTIASDDQSDYFLFHRKSERQGDGSLRVEEERNYWYHSEVVRWTRRSASFPPGATAEMKPVPMVTRSLVNLSPDDQRTDRVMDPAHEIYKALLAFPPEKDPAAGADPEWARVKLIKGSLSPNGHYQLAWSPKEKDFDWKTYKEEDQPNDFMVEPEADVINYVADLQTHRVIGQTLGKHFGTRQHYNHFDCTAAWSPDSTIFVELTTGKWDYRVFCAGQVKDGALIGCIDVAKVAIAAAGKFLTAKKDAAWRKYRSQLSIQFGGVEVADNDVISFVINGEVPKSELPDTSFVLKGRMRLTATAKGLQAAPMDFAYSSRRP